ncbi:DNA methylase N-4/N-6 domain protein [Ancylobacter novellus DSM 506]|uniref:Methyltransferase n=1 Tax=Ancylobacter novellus (strain ATCC 8093 / DSM 506 / JCM 20403 / CCM 1077 / IAM 12100 / NBRC 12443 / NCIMB 10456) TaxID=639283 RepID=D6ZZS7_ANCN5|nr:DNA methyltransferase [Ancylobacter novellus]ADH87341.1 DNA methylase N-4/N-6 domain protein [Ancylobacter novellus DSM 506]
MTPETFLDGRVTLYCGDSRDALDLIEPNSVDNCVCDPPYALVSIGKRFGKEGAAPAKGGVYQRASGGFMGQSWDTGEVAFDAKFWRKVFRALKPGGHVIAFGGTRAYHRLAVAIEDAGFEIRDSIGDLISLDPMVRAFVDSLDEAQLDAFLRIADLIGFEGLLAWVYGTGFPKSHDVSKAIDKMAGAERPVVGFDPVAAKRTSKFGTNSYGDFKGQNGDVTAPATAAAAAWQGWGTALKPAWEPIVLARKPLIGTVAENVLEHGTGALNVDGCRVGDEVRTAAFTSLAPCHGNALGAAGTAEACRGTQGEPKEYVGRHPANIIHDGTDEVVSAFPETESGAGAVKRATAAGHQGNALGRESRPAGTPMISHGDSGSASRFFYSAKADADDRLGSKHPTVKPVDLMQWLVRLVTAKGGTVLDPFAGTGTTGEAAWREGCNAVLIERNPPYQADIRRRMALCTAGSATRKRAARLARAEAEGKAPEFGPLFGGLTGPEAAE